MKIQPKAFKFPQKKDKRAAGTALAEDKLTESQMEDRIAAGMAADDANKLGRTIRQRRISAPFSLNGLAKATGISTGHLSRIEKGQRNPSARVLHKLAEPLGFRESELFVLAGYLSSQDSSRRSSDTSHPQPTTPQEPVKRIHAITTALPEVRQDWLKRYEEYGEPPVEIARKDGYDARTVRKQIQHAQQEREVREGRLMALKDAIESHHRDLCEFATQLNSRVAEEAPVSDETRNDAMWLALRQHLPRLAMWKSIDKWDSMLEKIVRLGRDIKARLERDLEADARLREIAASGGSGVLPGMVKALTYQTEQWPRGKDSLRIKGDFVIKPDKGTLVAINYGPSSMGKVSRRQAKEVMDILARWEITVNTWPEYDDMKELVQEMKRIQQKLQDGLTTIAMRRIVPGQCKYCPA